MSAKLSKNFESAYTFAAQKSIPLKKRGERTLNLFFVSDGERTLEALFEAHHGLGVGDWQCTHLAGDEGEDVHVTAGMHLYDKVITACHDIAFGDFFNTLELLDKLIDICAALSAYAHICHHMESDSSRVYIAVRAGYHTAAYEALYSLMDSGAGHAIVACYFEIRSTGILTQRGEDGKVELIEILLLHGFF